MTVCSYMWQKFSGQTIFYDTTKSSEIENFEKSQNQPVLTGLFQWFFSSFVDFQPDILT